MKKSIFVIIVIISVFISTSAQKHPLPEVDPEQKKIMEYVMNHYMTPENYIISEFKDHDVVIVGEWHRLKHDVELIQQLIPKLYENGVFILATEFARREDQHLIDSLLNNNIYDQLLAEKITLLQFVHWGYKEYVDIYKAAWQWNKNLDEGKRKFRILALGDSPDWGLIKSQEDRDNPEIKRKVWQGGGENLWAKVILDEVVDKGEKALVYCGIHHGFTEYNQPIYDFNNQKFVRFVTNRLGNYIYKEIGKRAMTIYLHAPWISAEGWDKPSVYPVDGIIDAIMRELPLKYRRVGFDTKDTPFGMLTCNKSYYKYGYDNFRLEMFCDGYILQKPLSEYEGVTIIEDFINEKNIDYARSQSPNPRFRNASIEDFNNAMKRSADIKKRYAHLY